MNCKVKNCTSPVRSRGLCRAHYHKLLRYGDPLHQRTVGNVMAHGYIRTMINREMKFDHVRAAEKALGRPMPAGVEVHHADYKTGNNANTNLVICQNAEYHDLLHTRTNALNACGHADWRKCRFCKKHDAPSNLFISKTNVHHRECMNRYYRNKRKEKPT